MHIGSAGLLWDDACQYLFQIFDQYLFASCHGGALQLSDRFADLRLVFSSKFGIILEMKAQN